MSPPIRPDRSSTPSTLAEWSFQPAALLAVVVIQPLHGDVALDLAVIGTCGADVLPAADLPPALHPLDAQHRPVNAYQKGLLSQ